MFSLLIINIMRRPRSQKLIQFYKSLKPKNNENILEVGVDNYEYLSVDNFLIKKYLYLENITALKEKENIRKWIEIGYNKLSL